MRTRPDESPLPGARDEDWDEGVLVWNATVAWIPAKPVTRAESKTDTRTRNGEPQCDHRPACLRVGSSRANASLTYDGSML